MNIATFLEHWGLSENPFRDEEALHDAVFRKLSSGGGENGRARGSGSGSGSGADGEGGGSDGVMDGRVLRANAHPDFEKVLGDLSAPSTSIVFGEKGSGKTAIRLQLGDAVRRFNASRGTGRVFLVAYDEWNPVLDRFAEREGLGASAEQKDAVQALSGFRLIDHMDGMVSEAVRAVVDVALGSPARLESGTVRASALGEGEIRSLRRAPIETRRDALVLAAVYDGGEMPAERMRALRKKLRIGMGVERLAWRAAMWAGWLPAVAVLVLALFEVIEGGELAAWSAAVLGAAWVGVLVKVLLVDRVLERSAARRVARHARVVGRGSGEMADALGELPWALVRRGGLPEGDHEESRYAVLGKLRSVLQAMNYSSMLVLIDRVDEPSLIRGDSERMRAVVWPLMDNKFLQMPGVAVKALLPIELRYELFRESSGFFQSARLDKQNLVERLSWSGAMLYDLCNSRLRACRVDGRGGGSGEGAESLKDLFAEDVSRQDLVDALDQMHQPRDAFKLIYRCISEHCSNVTEEEGAWRVPRLTLDGVRRSEAERVQMFARGVRPA